MMTALLLMPRISAAVLVTASRAVRALMRRSGLFTTPRSAVILQPGLQAYTHCQPGTAIAINHIKCYLTLVKCFMH